MNSRDSHTCDELSRHLRSYTLSFLPPLLIRNALPSPIHMKVAGATVTSQWVTLDLGSGEEQEVCSINVRDKYLILRIRASGSITWRHLQLRRCDGFTKEFQFPGSHDTTGNAQEDTVDVMRVLFTVHVDEACGQTILSICSPIWVVNKCGVPVNVLLPSIGTAASLCSCMDSRLPQVLQSEPCLSSEVDTSKLSLLGFSGLSPTKSPS